MTRRAWLLIAALGLALSGYSDTFSVTNLPFGTVPVSVVPAKCLPQSPLVYKTIATKALYQCGDDGAYHAISGGSGTTTFSFINANGFTGSVASPSTTPALTLSYSSQSANLVLASPNGSSGTPLFRALLAADVPALAPSKITGIAVITTDSRLSDSRAPTAHAASHQNGGSDEIATATATANAIPKAGVGGTLAAGWIPTLNQNTTGTAAALAANGVNCSAGQIPLGIDASGNVEGCYAPTASTVGLGSVTNDAQTKAAVLPNTAPSSGQIPVGNAGGTAYAPQSITGDGSLASTGALTFTTVNGSPGTYGDASHVGQTVVNGKGLTTSGSSVAIVIPESAVTNLVSDLAAKQATGNYVTALTGDVAASGPGSAAATLKNTGAGAGGCTACNVTFDAQGRETTYSSGAAGASPVGSGSEFQYRVDSSTFGAVTGSSVSGANMTMGTTGHLALKTSLDYDNNALQFTGHPEDGISYRSANVWDIVNNHGPRIRFESGGSTTTRIYSPVSEEFQYGVAIARNYVGSTAVTLSTSGTTTDDTSNPIPANSCIRSVSYFITTTIATATAFNVRLGASGNPFFSTGTATTSQTVLTSGTSGILHPPYLETDRCTAGSALNLRVTTTGTPTAGAIHFVTVYETYTAPSS